MSAAVLREVRLYGALGRKFGRVHRMAVATPAEAVRALKNVLDGFAKFFVGDDGRQAYHVFVGRGVQRRDIAEAETLEPLGAAAPIRIVPVVAGAKRGGALQTILGAVLIVVGALTYSYGGGALISLGASMMIGGVIQMLSPQRKGKDAPSNLPSYVYDGPINNTEQGGPVPCVYGRAIVGSVVVSQGITTDSLIAPASGTVPSNLHKLPGYEPADPYEDRGGGG